MSRRVVKKYEQMLAAQKEEERKQDAAEEWDVGENVEDDALQTSREPRNLFDLLDDDEENDVEDTEHGDGNIEVNANISYSTRGPSSQRQQLSMEKDSNSIEQKYHTKKKSRRRKRKNARGNLDAKNSDPDWEALLEDPNADGNENFRIDEQFFEPYDTREFRKEANELYAQICERAKEELASESIAARDESLEDGLESSLQLISVEPRLLSADAELKQLFGSKVVEAERRNEDMENSRHGNRRARGYGRGASRKQVRRKFSLVTPRDGWFGEVPGLNMVIDTAATVAGATTNRNMDGIRYYRFEYEGAYAKIQEDYRAAILMHDVNSIVELVRRTPFHVDSLIQLAEVYQQMGELDQAAEYIERSIYILECAWNIGFKPFNGECRMRFEVAENRALYIALFRYAQLLSRRGLHRTALEIAKLLLNLDPENDPMGILLIMDTMALESCEFEWVCKMCKKFKMIAIKNYPNFSFSYGLAVHSFEQSDTSTETASDHSKNTKKKKLKPKPHVGAVLESPLSAEEILTDALIAFPMALASVVEQIPNRVAAKPITGVFGQRAYEPNKILLRMCKIYAERSRTLWNEESKQKLVQAAAANTCELANGDERFVKGRALHDAAAKYFEENGLYTTALVEDFTNRPAALPADVLQQAQIPEPQLEDAVHLPPLPRELQGEHPTEALHADALQRAPPLQGRAVENLDTENGPAHTVGFMAAAREFVHSLLPWRDVGDAVRELRQQQQGDGSAVAGAARNDDDDDENAGVGNNAFDTLREALLAIQARFGGLREERREGENEQGDREHAD